MNKYLEKIKLGFSITSLLVAVILFLSVLGWNDEYLGHQIGGKIGDAITNLGSTRHWVAIFPMLFLALAYPLIALFELDFKPFLVVYLGGGGCIILGILAFFLFAISSSEE